MGLFTPVNRERGSVDKEKTNHICLDHFTSKCILWAMKFNPALSVISCQWPNAMVKMQSLKSKEVKKQTSFCLCVDSVVNVQEEKSRE